MFFTSDRNDAATAIIEGRALDSCDIRDAELARARHALAYLKHRLGNDAIRALLGDDLREMQSRVRGWVEESSGAWRTASLKLLVPGPTAREFQNWYVDAMARAREVQLRAGHPEHFLSHPANGFVEVLENIGETELPWRVFYRLLPDDFAYPTLWDPAYTLHYGMELLDVDGLRVGFSMRESRDDDDGLHLMFTTHLPHAAPPELVLQHLRHFAVEFRNWTAFARREKSATLVEGS